MYRRNFIKKTAIFAAGLPLLRKSGVKAMQKQNIPPSNIPEPSEWKSDDINIAWIGHSTILMNFFGKIIITDPVFFNQIGVNILGLVIGPTRYSQPALRLEQIPKPDLLLLSHAHLDHMDFRSLSSIAEKYPNEVECLTAYNTKDVIEELPWKRIQELDWNERTEIEGISIRAIEVKHFGWRYPFEKDRSRGYFKDGRSFNAYVLERNGKKILFGGDTAFTGSFRESGEQVDIAIMPIGAYNPWKFNHCNPEEALQMAHDVHATVFIPIHCNTFRQGLEPVEEPLQLLKDHHEKYNISLGLSEIGETYKLST